MMKISDFRIGTKLIVGFIVVIAIFGAAIYYQIRTLQNLAVLQDEGAKRSEDALAIAGIVKRVEDVYGVMADGVINRNFEETQQEFGQVKTQAQQDIAAVRELVDTAEEEAWAETFAKEYLSYLELFEKEMLPILEKDESAEKRFADSLTMNLVARRVDEVYAVIADGVINRNLEETTKDFEQIKKEALQDVATVQELVDAVEEEAWAETFAKEYLSYLEHFEKEMLPILEKDESAEKRFADSLAMNAIARRVDEVYAVIADGVINRNFEETTKDFEQIKKQVLQDVATVQELVDTAEEKAWAETFGEQYSRYLDLFENRMLPLLQRVDYSDWEEIRRLDDQIDRLRDATLEPLDQITTSLEQESAEATQDMVTIRELDGEIDALRIATLAPLDQIITSLDQESHAANQDMIKIREVDREIDASRTLTETPLDNINQSLVQESIEADAIFDATRQRAIQLATGISVSGSAIALLFAFVITFSITRPLREAVVLNNKLAEGDLNLEIRVKGKDEIGQLQSAMQHMLEKLQEVVVNVQSGAMNVASGSEEMSQGASEQAASAEEASSSMEEMVANIQQNADNASQTEKLAVKAATDAQESGQAVAQTVEAMHEIVKKIGVIEEIARQTHMLSLNATIEAARAEQYGKGFGVVAAEVRSLASRAQEAAVEINAVASDSITVAEKAGELLHKLVPDIQKTAELVQEISAASKEQTSGAGQINQAIQQLDQVVQQNASVSEELAAQAEQLQGTVAFFNLDGAGGRAIEHDLKVSHTQLGAKVAHIKVRKDAETGTKNGDAKGAAGYVVNMKHRTQGEDELDEEFERY